MPIVLVVFAALFGLGYFAHEELSRPPAPPQPATLSADHSRWARACEAKLAEAARTFEHENSLGCSAGTVEITALPSGVDYVEYSLRTADGSTYLVSVTEEPQHDEETTGWRGSPGCHGFYRDYQVVRHDHGRLAMVRVTSPFGFQFATTFEPAVDFCIEQAQ